MNIRSVAAFVVLFAAASSFVDDWGYYSIIPVSAPKLVLEAVDSGTTDGTVISIAQPTGQANQKWIVKPKDDDRFVVKPSYSSAIRSTTTVRLPIKNDSSPCTSPTGMTMPVPNPCATQSKADSSW